MTFAELVYGTIVPIVDSLIVPLLYAAAFLFFIIGIFRYFIAGDDAKRTEGRSFAIWGLIALAVIFSVWGLVRVLINTIL
jgi:hypothetical protein